MDPDHQTTTATIVCVDADGGAAEASAREEVERRLGQLIATTGEQVVAGFSSATAALSTALAVKAATGPATDTRIGLAAGDLTSSGGVHVGAPITIAAGLRCAADPGHILATTTVRALAAEHDDIQFGPVRSYELDGASVPVLAVHVVPAGAAEAVTLAPWALPPVIAATGATPFVGRAAESKELEDLLASVGEGSRAVLIGGEAGAGKTRLAVETARSAAALGAAVLWGSCDRDLSGIYQPWVAVLGELLEQVPDDVLMASRSELGHLRRILPSPPPVVSEAPVPPPSDPDTERFQLFEAVARVLRLIAGHVTLVVFLDDLHWAGTEALALLRHVVRERPPTGLLVVGMFRDTGDEVGEPLASTLAALRRDEAVVRMSLGGLDNGSVARYVEAMSGRPLDAASRDLARRIADRTGGNPFLMGELWRHIADRGGSGDVDADVPDSVREVVGDRIRSQPDAVREIAELAAIAGLQVEYRTLCAASDRGEDEVSDALDALVEAGLMVEAATPGSQQFVHDLLRDAVVETLTPLARARLHLRMGEAVEAVHADDVDARAPQLARLFGEAAAIGGTARSIRYARRAAASAARAFAYDEASEYLARAVVLPGVGGRDRAAMLIEQAEVQTRGGRFSDGMRSGVDAVQLATEQGDVELLARGAIAITEALTMGSFHAEPFVPVCERALVELGSSRPSLRRHLLVSYGRTLALAGRTGEAIPIIDEVMAEARRVGDDVALGWGFSAQLATDDRRLDLRRICDENDLVAARLGDSWLATWSISHAVFLDYRAGDLTRVRTDLERCLERASRGRYPLFRFMSVLFEHTLARVNGEFELAEEHLERAQELVDAELPGYDVGWYGLAMYCVRRDQGRLGEVAPVLQLIDGDASSSSRIWTAGLAAVNAEVGMTDRAERVLDGIAEQGLDALPHDGMWPATLALLADACARVGHRALAEPLLRELDQWRGTVLMAGFTTAIELADTCRAAMLRTLGRLEEASSALAAAEDLAGRSGSVVWQLRADAERVALMQAAGHHHEAAHLAGSVRERAQAIGMGALADLGAAAADGTPDVATHPDNLTDREVEVLGLLAEGCSNKEIGERLFISVNTAANHVRSILTKTGSANRTEAAVYSTRLGDSRW